MHLVNVLNGADIFDEEITLTNGLLNMLKELQWHNYQEVINHTIQEKVVDKCVSLEHQ